ncbi:hypothetical protein N7510_002643 [Penicillium lagena]|uniref:uncharacterized protein n=1 Tax=Penicillium lagena TaxID=94218 RepID=UPI002541FFAC|nr:uncharacterized protein N7510_002643 [Penicillium lagena]KAJ5626334.1 hypothetical protein N7510_002643 [Penicillium lagena]
MASEAPSDNGIPSRNAKRKAKCDGKRPLCSLCAVSGHVCKYPEDARLGSRPSRAEVEALRNELDRIRQLLNNPETPSTQASKEGLRATDTQLATTSNVAVAECESSRGTDVRPDNSIPKTNLADHHLAYAPGTASTEGEGSSHPIADPSSLASNETQIACAIEEDGSIHVHGISSHLYQPSAQKSPSRERSGSRNIHGPKYQAVKDQLFANAAYQRQREASLIYGSGRSLGPRIDFDGLAPELALHLLELHWNRQHYLYLMTYRPAFFDSLANNGPYAHKLLLNSIYFSSCCLDSDRSIFKPDINEPHRRGERFYSRCKALLMDEIDKPSLPTIVSLVVLGTTLVSTGQPNAGWVLCGTAYRMIIDMGLHLSTSPWQDDGVPETNLTPIEIEMRARIYWASFMIDNYQSLYLGRPSYLRAANARISRDFYDYYEELESWTPYLDPEEAPSGMNSLLGSYKPRPVYAISSFKIFTALGEIASRITNFYAIGCVKIPVELHIAEKREIRAELDTWVENIPPHLRFDPLVDPPPPPNQFVPHALYHTLTILLERPFLSSGHLSPASNPESQALGQKRCTESAFKIWQVLNAYQKAFTFRRAPYLLSYATYCAIVVLLNQKETHGDEYEECIRFFWFALLRIQKGTHFGLRKPLQILQGLMYRVGKVMPDRDPRENEDVPSQLDHRVTNESFTIPINHGSVEQMQQVNDYPIDTELEAFLQQNAQQGNWPTGDWLDTLINEFGQIDDSLIGLMDSQQPVIKVYPHM